ncbi:bifunctional non-homologous end joining protein LigD [Streptomyces sp. Amel2xC10]|nr:bifunctional non-homologous end joining protein LigD [Streptomyces sp. Amel2xC10]
MRALLDRLGLPRAPMTTGSRGLHVVVPLERRHGFDWEQLDDPGLGPRRWSVADALEQARTRPWSELGGWGRALGPARRRLDRLRASPT